MIAMLKGLAILVIVTLTLSACQATTGRTAGETVDDATITAAVKTKLAGERAATLTRVDVDTTRGVVYLNGVVDDPVLRTRATQLALEVDGVREVVNNLQVRPR